MAALYMLSTQRLKLLLSQGRLAIATSGFIRWASGPATRVIRLYDPAEPHHVSYSALNLHRKSTYIEAQVKTLRTLSEELGHDRIDLIKMDVEGAEQVVIPNMIAENILPTVFCVEYDQPLQNFSLMTWRCFWMSLRLNADLLNSGYKLVSKNGWTATYLRTARC